ncbi:MAG: hypothetical protein M1821_008206 [Bathelium mastoideum]|nr:MAG: hypothetical protein M1821_008206 [Bathelium mastoideum]
MASWTKLVALGLAVSISAFPSKRSTNFCGESDSQVISGTPWIVFNMLYNEDLMSSSDSWCTVYDSLATSSTGVQEIKWGSTSSISPASDTVKGYSFIGLTQNLENTLTGIQSIPANYQWTRSNTTEFKGNIVFDFMTNDVKGDSTSTDSHELMLWLQYEGGQTPIGWSKTPAYTVDSLYGTSWKLYEGVNEDTGITVSSLLPDTQFDGSFSGDLMDWFQVFVTRGTFKNSTYLNVGNAGTEIFYGDSTMSSTLALQIDLPGSSSPEEAAAEAAISADSAAATSALTTSAKSSKAISSTVAAVATSSFVSAPATTNGVPSTPETTSAPPASPIALTTASTASGASSTDPSDSEECSDELSQDSNTAIAATSTTSSNVASATTSGTEPNSDDGSDDCDSDEQQSSIDVPSSTTAAVSNAAGIFPTGPFQPSGVALPTGFPHGSRPHWRPGHHDGHRKPGQ